MVIYNITTKVHGSIDAEWLQWQWDENLPAIMATGFFTSHQLLRLLEQDDSEGKTYALQFTADTMSMYNAYTRTHGAFMRQQAIDRWGSMIISFHSLLEVIQ